MKNLRKTIKDILDEEFLVKEIVVSEKEPHSYEEFDLVTEFQYGFKTQNENIYYLSLKQTTLNIEDESLLGDFENVASKNGQLTDFYAVNFYSSEKNPNDNEAFKQVTNNDEPLLILSNIIWLVNNFCNKHNKDRVLFSAEPRRMRLYQNAFDNFKDTFHILGPDNFDSTYDYKQVLMFKK